MYRQFGLLRCRSGHGSFSNNKKLNDLIGNITHASILVPYHGWRISHRTHHANHGHVENDESWYPTASKIYEDMVSPCKCPVLDACPTLTPLTPRTFVLFN